ncbi:protein-tyrosine-phosphatase [Micromonospora sicca]|uniref:arsenate reductase/protein-tyrosine-phosphatase family protein n=1 Tax=Micromonospora sicca TaxID=2202420 RepID=UPI001374D9D8|nr:protein-tyrosine-phosphatase [Micromonospora sp. 4G51]
MGGILHVCTGNQARSPIAERLMELGLRRRFGAAADAIYVTSAGTRGPAGSPMQRMAVAELERRAARHDNFVSQLLDLKAVERAHLVLTATRQHRDEIISQVPSAIRHTFTWRELAWLASGLKPGEVPGRYPLDRVARLAWVVTKRRGYLSPPPPEQFDIADPMGRPKQHYRVAAAQIEEAIESILDVL